jgi:hypothetical protein
MAFDIHPANQRSMTASYSRSDGPGEVEAPPEWELSNESLATLLVEPDGMSAKIQHSGGVGEVTLTVTADGDLGTGVFPIVLSEIFTMLPPRGATGGTLGVGNEEPITPPV